MTVLATCGGEIAQTSQTIGAWAAAFAIGITVVLLLLNAYRGSFAWAPLYVSVLIFHPTWTIGIQNNNCGESMRFLSVAFSGVLGAILFCQVFWPYTSRQRFILVLCLSAWALYLVNWPLFVVASDWLEYPLGNKFGDELVSAFLAAEKDLLIVALAFSLACFLPAIGDSLRRRGLVPCRFARQETDHAHSQERKGGDGSDLQSKSHSLRSRVILSILALILLLMLTLLSAVSPTPLYGGNRAFSTVAFLWIVILTISAARGKFPGWAKRS